MKAILPRKVTLVAEFIDSERVSFSYEETFAPGEEGLAADAASGIRALIPPGVHTTPTGPLSVCMTGTVPFTLFGDMMAGEWLHWSTLGNASMSTILKAIGRTLQDTRPGRVKLRDVLIAATRDLGEDAAQASTAAASTSG